MEVDQSCPGPPWRECALDHVAISVDNLDETLARLKSEGVTVVSGPRRSNGLRSAFVEAPDRMELELVEGHATR